MANIIQNSQATEKIKFDMQIESIVTEMAWYGLARLVNMNLETVV